MDDLSADDIDAFEWYSQLPPGETLFIDGRKYEFRSVRSLEGSNVFCIIVKRLDPETAAEREAPFRVMPIPIGTTLAARRALPQ